MTRGNRVLRSFMARLIFVFAHGAHCAQDAHGVYDLDGGYDAGDGDVVDNDCVVD